MTELEAVKAVIDALDAAAAPYMLTGSFASNAYGIARSTKDADVIVDFKVADLDKIVANLDPRIRLQEQLMFETITGTTRHILEVAGSPFRIELFHVNPDPFTDLSRRLLAEGARMGAGTDDMIALFNQTARELESKRKPL